MKTTHSALLAICTAVCTWSVSASADLAKEKHLSEKNTPKTTFVREEPEGFAELDTITGTNYIDLYYQRYYLGSFKTDIHGKTLVLADPSSIVDKLNKLMKLAERTQLVRSLKKPLNLNSDYVCNFEKKPNNECRKLVTDDIAIIFDESTFTAKLLIGKKYMPEIDTDVLLLPDSSAGFSWIHRITGITNGDLSNDDKPDYRLENASVIAYKKARFNARTSLENNTGADIQSFRLNNANLEWNFSRYMARIGLQRTFGTNFIAGRNILGASVSTDLRLVENQGDLFNVPLIVYLPNPSQVSIYLNDELINSRSYQQGNQIISTSSLPSGSYEIELEIKDSSGKTTRETRFFVKSVTLPPRDFPLYHASVGLFESTSSQKDFLPKTTGELIYEAGTQKRLFGNYGFSFDTVGTDKLIYGVVGIFYQGNNFSIEPIAATGSDGDIALGLNMSYLANRSSLTFSARQVLANSKEEHQDELFNPIVSNSSQATLFYQQNLSDISTLRLRGIYTKNENQDRRYSISADYEREIYNAKHFAIDFSLDATKTETDYFGFVEFVLSWDKGNWAGSVNTGYAYEDIQDQNNNPGFVTGTSISYSKNNKDNELFHAGAFASKNSSSESYGADTRYRHSLFTLHGQYTDTLTHSNRTQFYNGRIVTNLAYVAGHFGIGSNKGNSLRNSAAIFVNVESPLKGETFRFRGNANPGKKIKTDKLTPIFVNAFENYRYSLRADTDIPFSYDQADRHATLYPGNVIYESWSVQPKNIIITSIQDHNGTPLVNALITGGIDPNFTDVGGFIQLEVLANVKQLNVTKNDGTTCLIELPDQLKANELGYIDIEKLTCIPTKGPAKPKNQLKN